MKNRSSCFISSKLDSTCLTKRKKKGAGCLFLLSPPPLLFLLLKKGESPKGNEGRKRGASNLSPRAFASLPPEKGVEGTFPKIGELGNGACVTRAWLGGAKGGVRVRKEGEGGERGALSRSFAHAVQMGGRRDDGKKKGGKKKNESRSAFPIESSGTRG